MRALIFTAGLAVAVSSGCGGTGFTAGLTQLINLHLGKVTAACNTTGASTGIPADDGSQTSFVHQPSGNTCVITSQWQGSLISMTTLRQQIARDEPDSHKDMSGLQIKHLDIDVNHISFNDVSTGKSLDLPSATVLAHHDEVGLTGVPVVTLDFSSASGGAGSSDENPKKTIQNETALRDRINAVLVSGNVPGVGSANVSVSMSDMAKLEAAADPAISFHMDYDVSGGDIGS